MFKFKHHNSYQPHCPHSPVSSNNPVLDNNQLGNLLEVENFVTTAGQEHIWKVYSGWRKSDGKVFKIQILFLFPFSNKLQTIKHMPYMYDRIEMLTEFRQSKQILIKILIFHPKYQQHLFIKSCRLVITFSVGKMKGSQTSSSSSLIVMYKEKNSSLGVLMCPFSGEFLSYFN